MCARTKLSLNTSTLFFSILNAVPNATTLLWKVSMITEVKFLASLNALSTLALMRLRYVDFTAD